MSTKTLPVLYISILVLDALFIIDMLAEKNTIGKGR